MLLTYTDVSVSKTVGLSMSHDLACFYCRTERIFRQTQECKNYLPLLLRTARNLGSRAGYHQVVNVGEAVDVCCFKANVLNTRA